MREKAVFRIIYGILLAALILLTDYAVVYVQDNIDEYEASQPSHVVDRVTEEFGAALKEGKAAELLTFPELEISPYDGDLYGMYFKKLSSVSEWNWKIVSGSYSDSRQIYGLYGDGELLVKLFLESEEARTILGILTVNSWKEAGLYPAITVTEYTEYVEVPEGYSVFVNGLPVEKDSECVTCTEKDGNVTYCLTDLHDLYDAEVFDPRGRKCEVFNDNGYITPVLNYFNLIVPENFVLSDEGTVLAGEKGNQGVQYRFASVSDSILMEDGHGNSTVYKKGDNVTACDVAFSLPDSFTVKWGKEDVSRYETGRTLPAKYADYTSYARMPYNVRYEIKGLLKLPELDITDNNGNKVQCDFNENYFEIAEQTGLSEIPPEITSKTNPVDGVKVWSLFLTNDLKGSRHGFATLKNYLVEGTPFYSYAEDYSKTNNISFASNHDSVEFIEEKVSNYVKYSDDVFSCDIYLKKSMHLTDDVKTNAEEGMVYDVINSTFFFLKNGDEWKILGLWAKVED